jgi:hypothetical protein
MKKPADLRAGDLRGYWFARPTVRSFCRDNTPNRLREDELAREIRGVMFEENLDNTMGLEFYNLSHRFGYQSPNWPYFEDVKIERIHYMAKSGVLSQRITTSMHNTTHIDAPAHVVQGTPFIDEVPLPHFFGSGIVVSIPKKKWEPITGDDLEAA